MGLKAYLAHPLSDYNTKRETRAISAIERKWPGASIVNPNRPVCQLGYSRSGMEYFYKLIKKCNILVAVPFPDGEYGMGVWREMDVAVFDGIAVYKYPRLHFIDHRDIRPLSIMQTREHVERYIHG